MDRFKIANAYRLLECAPLAKVDAILGKRRAEVGEFLCKGMAMVFAVSKLDEHWVWEEGA